MAIIYSIPTSFETSPASDTTMALYWVNSETSPNIEIQRKPEGGTYSTISIEAPESVGYQDTGCSGNIGYYHRIRYNDLAGGFSNWVSSSLAYTLPAAPSNLAVSWSGKTATLTWTNNGAAYTYIGIYYKLSSEPTTWTTDTSTLTGTATTRGITVTTENVAYDFRVRGYNSTSSQWSSYDTVSNSTSGTMAPTNLLLTSASTTSITVTWTDNSSVEDGYEVYYMADGDEGYTLFETTAADAGTSTITGLDEDTEYTIRVRAKAGSYYSEYATDTIYTGSAPDAAPVIGTVTVVSQTALTVSWTCDATNEDGFTVLRSTDDITYEEIGTADEDATSYADTGLDSYVLYYYKIRAYNAHGVSDISDSASGTTTIDLDPPTALYAEALSSTQIKLNFTVNAGNATAHYVERRTSGGSYSAIGNTDGATTATYTDGTCSADTEYTYRVRAYNSVSGTYGDYCVPVTKKTLAVGTDTVRRNEAYFALGNVLCIASETPQNSFQAYWRSKPIDFGEVDPADADKFKTVDLVQIEYVDKYSSVPTVVSLSTNDGLTWTNATSSIGIGDDASHVANFNFSGVTARNISLKISSEDSDTKFCWTGITIRYIVRGDYIEVSPPATAWDGGEFGTIQLNTIDGGGF